MRVLYVIPGLGGGGGAEQSLAAMAPHLVAQIELEVAVLSDRGGLIPTFEESGLNVTRIHFRRRQEVVSELRRLIGDASPDLVHTTLWEADVAGRLASLSRRVPVSSSLVNIAYGRRHRSSPHLHAPRVRAAQLVDMATARGVVRFHALTEAVAGTMSRRLAVPRARIDVIPRGREPEELGHFSRDRRMRARTALGVGSRPLVIATARHNWQKGLDVLVRGVPLVVRELPDVQILIGGPEADQTPLLRQLITELRLEYNVSLIGPRTDVAELMCAADAFCMPSRWEGFGGILIEAMALGTPTVATSIATTHEVTGNGAWVELVRPDDPDALARGLLKVLGDPTWRSRTRHDARRRFIEKYTAENASSQMIDFFEKAVSSSRFASRNSSASVQQH